MSDAVAAMTPSGGADAVAAMGPSNTPVAPSLMDQLGAAFRTSRDDQIGHEIDERNDAYGAVAARLGGMGHDAAQYALPVTSGPQVNYDGVWQDVEAERAKNPRAFADLPGTQAEFEKQWQGQMRQRQAEDASTVSRSGVAPWLVGGFAGGLTDPINLGTMALGGGPAGGLLRTAARDALLNAGATALQQPFVAAERQDQGRDFSLGEAAENVGAAALFGGAFGAVLHGAGAVWGKLSDGDLAAAFRAKVPDHLQTPDESDALHTLDAAHETQAASPFTDTHAGLALHTDKLQAALDAGQGGTPAPVVSPTPGTHPDFDNAWAAIVGNEGGTAPDGSFRTSPAGAIGPAQLMPATARMAARVAGVPFDDARYRGDAGYNTALGRAWYADLLKRFEGDPVKAAAAYNAGEGSAARGTGVRGAMARADAEGQPGAWISHLPGETQAYVANFARRTGASGDIAAPDLASGDAAPGDTAAIEAQAPPVPVDRIDVESAAPKIRPELVADQGPAVSVDYGTRAPRTNGPEDMLKFIARQGGLSYDGLSPDRVLSDAAGHDLRNSGALDTFVPGGGPLLRPKGRSLDQMGELLHDAGYFGPPSTTPRPTESELITLLDDTIRSKSKVYSTFDQAPEPKGPKATRDPGVPKGYQSAEHFEADRARWKASGERVLGRDISDEEFGRANAIASEGLKEPFHGAGSPEYQNGEHYDPYLREMVNREMDGAIEDAYHETKDDHYAAIEQQFRDTAADGEAGDAGPRGEGSAADAGDAPAGDQGGRDGARDDRPHQLSPAEQDELAAAGARAAPAELAQSIKFDDPAGEGVQAAADSAWHDIRMRSEVALPPENTRGKGVFFHGARGEVPELSEGYYNPANIYGGFDTFYTTDAADIALGYGRKQASAKIYRVEDKAPVNFFSMEERQPAEFWNKLFRVDDLDGLKSMAIDDSDGGDQPNLREIMDAMREFSSGEGISRDEVQEYFDSMILNLRDAGFEGMTHIGGLKTGKVKHSVRIYFDAPNHVTLHDVTPPASYEPTERSAPVLDPTEELIHELATERKVDRTADARKEPEAVATDAGQGTPAAGRDALDHGAAQDPGVAERQRQQAKLGAEAPMRAKAEQDGEMGLGLFDAVDQRKFDLGDGSTPRTAGEIAAELQAEKSGIDAIRGCLT